MNFVIVVRVPEPFDTAVTTYAAKCDLSPYEARSRLAGDLPRIGAVLANRADADALANALEQAKFGVCVVPASQIEHDEDRDFVHSLAFEPDACVFTLRTGAERRVPLEALGRIIQGVRTGTSTVTREHSVKKFSVSRAVLSGGLVTRKTETQTETHGHETREVFAYVFPAEGRTLALCERRLHYGFLGNARQASSFANFQTTVREILARVPSLPFDDRLMRPLGIGTVPLAPPSMDTSTWKSDLAVALRSLDVKR